MVRYFKAPILEHEQMYCCEHCFNLIGYLPEDVIKRVKQHTLSFERIVECPVCSKVKEV